MRLRQRVNPPVVPPPPPRPPVAPIPPALPAPPFTLEAIVVPRRRVTFADDNDIYDPDSIATDGGGMGGTPKKRKGRGLRETTVGGIKVLADDNDVLFVDPPPAPPSTKAKVTPADVTHLAALHIQKYIRGKQQRIRAARMAEQQRRLDSLSPDVRRYFELYGEDVPYLKRLQARLRGKNIRKNIDEFLVGPAAPVPQRRPRRRRYAGVAIADAEAPTPGPMRRPADPIPARRRPRPAPAVGPLAPRPSPEPTVIPAAPRLLLRDTTPIGDPRRLSAPASGVSTPGEAAARVLPYGGGPRGAFSPYTLALAKAKTKPPTPVEDRKPFKPTAIPTPTKPPRKRFLKFSPARKAAPVKSAGLPSGLPARKNV